MRYLLLILAALFILSSNVEAKEEWVDEVRDKVKVYTTECHNKAFPKEKMDEILSLYGGSMKQAEQDYSSCMKEIIVNKIDTEFPEESKKEMKEALDEIQSGILKLYWYLYNSQDNGLIGQLQNDAAMSRVYDKILEDIILYLTTYGKPKGWKDHTLLP